MSHAAAPAGGAEATPLAAERHDHFISAVLAPDVHAPVLEPATAQVGAEFAGDEGGEPVAAALVGGPGQEGFEMALEGAVKDGVLGSVALIGRRGTGPRHVRAGCSQSAWVRSEKEDNRKGLREIIRVPDRVALPTAEGSAPSWRKRSTPD
jgi:hypothetical protein